MNDKLARLVRVYAKMAELTRPVCMERCHEPGGCCRTDYCDMAADRAAECGVALPRQDHPMLPYLGPEGCVVPPHLRPLCAVHVCEVHLLPNAPDQEFARAYFKLRERVCEVEAEAGLSWPKGLARDYWE